MTQTITIEYKPIIGSEISHTRHLNVTPDQLFGIIIMTYAVSSPDRIIIKLSNNILVDITQSHILPFFGDKPDIYENTAKFMTHDISFNGMGLIEGGTQLCILLGIDPASAITNFKTKGISSELLFQRYFGIVSIPNFTQYNNGTTIPIDHLKSILSYPLVNSLSKTLQDCFPGVDIGITIPSELYIITQDDTRSDVIATCAAILHSNVTDTTTDPIDKYKKLGPYIFNVCTNNKFRNQGLSKSIMISMLNDLISKGYRNFTLEVLPTNKIAYSLYQSLGFNKVASTSDGTSTYDLLLLSL